MHDPHSKAGRPERTPQFDLDPALDPSGEDEARRRRAAEATVVTLTVTDGPHRGRAFSFRDHDNFIVGRSPEAHFRLPMKDKAFSRYHFMVEVNPPRCRITDMASTNGTFVTGRRVHAVDLKDGDTIKGGHTVLPVAVAGDDPAPDPAPAPADGPTRTFVPARSPARAAAATGDEPGASSISRYRIE